MIGTKFSWVFLALSVVALPACQPSSPQVDSQTNWLKVCSSPTDCAGLECICGTCTLSCTEDDTCAAQGLGTCRPADATVALVACDGQPPSGGLCLADCDDGECPDGAQCVAGVCLAAPEITASVEVDDGARHQALIGFGASLSYDEGAIVGHPDQEALLDAMFEDSGLDIVRLRNSFEPEGSGEAIDFAAEIIEGATRRLGRKPTLFLHGASPPPALKANGDRYCSNVDAECTLTRDTEGQFDYGAFAEYWRDSVQAFEDAGLSPDFLSIQNHPDWVPPDDVAVEACRFLPAEGATTITLPDGTEQEVDFAGYAEALAAIRAAVGDYEFAVAETSGPPLTQAFAPALDPADYSALAFNLYAIDPANVDTAALEAVADLSASLGKPVLQTEMQEGGLGTAILLHHALVSANASAYMQLHFVGLAAEEDAPDLISIADGTVLPRPAYHALRHFARSTDPGWVRIDATSNWAPLLSSAWIAPDDASLTLVLLNSGTRAVDTELSVPSAFEPALARARVTRTTFDGLERSADLGLLSRARVRVPGHAIVTLALTRD